jgi:hypothetical protein
VCVCTLPEYYCTIVRVRWRLVVLRETALRMLRLAGSSLGAKHWIGIRMELE